MSPSSPSAQLSTAKPLCFNPFTTNEAIFLSSSTTSTRIGDETKGVTAKEKALPLSQEGFTQRTLPSVFVNHYVAAAAFAPDAQQRALVLHVLGQLHRVLRG